MSIHQTTAAGTGPVRAYKGLGFQGGPGLYSLRNLFGMVVGEQNSGKSYLFQSCPDAFVINLDLSSTVSPHAKCAVWPGIGLDGRPMDVDGKPLIITWDHVEAKIKQLCDKHLLIKVGDDKNLRLKRLEKGDKYDGFIKRLAEV